MEIRIDNESETSFANYRSKDLPEAPQAHLYFEDHEVTKTAE